jgi:hypothetical protein
MPMDWLYLAQAQRPPKATFMPLMYAFAPAFVDRSFKDADIVFVDNRLLKQNPPAADQIIDLVKRNYPPYEHSTTLTLYRLQKSPQQTRLESLAR